MPYTNFICQFPGQPDLDINLLNKSLNCEIPEWSNFKQFPCPGGIEQCSNVGYCRLACEINSLVNYFSHISSYEQGYIYIYNSDNDQEDKKIIIQKDAQNIFFYALWLNFLRTPCNILKFHQKLRENYILTSDNEKLFYILFSIFLVDSHFNSPGKAPELNKFRKQLQLVQGVLSSLLERMRNELDQEADATNNGLVLFNTLVNQMEMEFDLFYQGLKKDVIYS